MRKMLAALLCVAPTALPANVLDECDTSWVDGIPAYYAALEARGDAFDALFEAFPDGAAVGEGSVDTPKEFFRLVIAYSTASGEVAKAGLETIASTADFLGCVARASQ